MLLQLTRTPANVELWVAAMRQTVKDAGFIDGWSVLNRRDWVQIQRTWSGPDGERIRRGVSTKIRFQRGCTAAVLATLTQLKSGLDRGLTLEESAELLLPETAANSQQHAGINWSSAVEKWRREKLSQGMLPRTFDKTDGMRMKYVLQRVMKEKPQKWKRLCTSRTLQSPRC